MDTRKIIVFSFIVFLLVTSLGVSAENSREKVCYQEIYAQPIKIWRLFDSDVNSNNEYPLNISSRVMVYNVVKSNPGIHFRGLCRALGMSIGSVQYHIRCLVDAGFISVFQDKKYKRFFEAGRFSNEDIKVISLLRNKTVKNIIFKLMGHSGLPHMDLVQFLGISSQALSWYMAYLKKIGVIDAETNARVTKYSLNDGYASIIEKCRERIQLL